MVEAELEELLGLLDLGVIVVEDLSPEVSDILQPPIFEGLEAFLEHVQLLPVGDVVAYALDELDQADLLRLLAIEVEAEALGGRHDHLRLLRVISLSLGDQGRLQFLIPSPEAFLAGFAGPFLAVALQGLHRHLVPDRVLHLLAQCSRNTYK